MNKCIPNSWCLPNHRKITTEAMFSKSMNTETFERFFGVNNDAASDFQVLGKKTLAPNFTMLHKQMTYLC